MTFTDLPTKKRIEKRREIIQELIEYIQDNGSLVGESRYVCSFGDYFVSFDPSDVSDDGVHYIEFQKSKIHYDPQFHMFSNSVSYKGYEKGVQNAASVFDDGSSGHVAFIDRDAAKNIRHGHTFDAFLRRTDAIMNDRRGKKFVTSL